MKETNTLRTTCSQLLKVSTSDTTCIELGFCTYFLNGCAILFWPKNNISLVQFCLIYVVTHDYFTDDHRIREVKPEGFVSRDQIEREFKFSKHVRLMKTNFLRNMIFIFQDFEGNKQHAIIAKQRGHTGIFFPLDAVSFQYDAIILNRIPADWIDEQTIIRLMIKFSRIYLYISEN